MNSEDRQHLEEILRTYQRRLRILEKQEAQYGSSTPPGSIVEIEDTRAKIAQIERRLENSQLLERNDFLQNSEDFTRIVPEKDSTVKDVDSETLLPSPSEVQRLATAIATFRRINNATTTTAFISAILLVVFSGSLLFGGDLTNSFSLSTCLFVIIIFAGSIIYILENIRSRVIIFPNRLECIKGLVKSSVLWRDVRDIKELIHYKESKPLDYRLIITREDNSKIDIDFAVDKVEEFVALTRKTLMPFLVNKFWSKYNSGKIVDFGVISVNQRQISNGEWALQWTQIADIIIDEVGMIQVIERDTTKRWYLSSFNGIPNAILLITIAPALIEQNNVV